MRRLILLLALACIGSVAPGTGFFDGAQGEPFDSVPVGQPDSPLSGTEMMIPMRDGTRLYTQVYAPKQSGEPLPIILLRTPYGTGALNPARVSSSLLHLVADGYIFVQQDIRGRFKSDGNFVMLRQPREHRDSKAPE